MMVTALHGGTPPLAALPTIYYQPCPSTYLITTNRELSQYPPFPTGEYPSCVPPAWAANIAGKGFDYYSPAICLHGFSVGPSCQVTRTSIEEGFPAIAPGETAVWCVPTGMTCTSDVTDFRGGVWGYTKSLDGASVRYTVGPALQIRFVEADLTQLQTHPLTEGLDPRATDVASAVSAATNSFVVVRTRSAPDGTPVTLSSLKLSWATLPPEPFSSTTTAIVPILSRSYSSPEQSGYHSPGESDANPSSVVDTLSDSKVNPMATAALPTNASLRSNTTIFVSRATSIAIVVLLTLLLTLALAALLVMWCLCRKYLQQRDKDMEHSSSFLPPVRYRLSRGRLVNCDETEWSCLCSPTPTRSETTTVENCSTRARCIAWIRRKLNVVAALGLGHPRGTATNPAKQKCVGVGLKAENGPWSWVSRLLSVGSIREGLSTLGRRSEKLPASSDIGGASTDLMRPPTPASSSCTCRTDDDGLTTSSSPRSSVYRITLGWRTTTASPVGLSSEHSVDDTTVLAPEKRECASLSETAPLQKPNRALTWNSLRTFSSVRTFSVGDRKVAGQRTQRKNCRVCQRLEAGQCLKEDDAEWKGQRNWASARQ